MTVPASRIPTLDKLGATISPNLDVTKIVSQWFQAFADHVERRNMDGIVQLFVEDSLWRDLLVLTWDFRTFDGITKIRQFLSDRLALVSPTSLRLRDFIKLQKPFPDLAWIVVMFEFETVVGLGSGVFRLVPIGDQGMWKAHTMFTNLEDLKGFPEKIGPFRCRQSISAAQWTEFRQREAEFKDGDPTVLIVGAGHSGLELAARLKYLDIKSLVVERHSRIGDNWRGRYEKLCLHWPVWFDHMPYIPFPPTWPLYTPASKMADWLESYAHSLDLNVWTSANVESASQDASNKWSVKVKRVDGSERVFHVNHLVFATGLGDAFPNRPSVPGIDEFGGIIMHSSEYKRAQDHIGKKVVVVGAGNSAHDVAADLASLSIDVTMFQRSSTFVMNLDNGWKYLGGALYSEDSPSVDVADRLFASMPHILQENGMAQRATRAIEDADREMLDGLKKAGFKLNHGINDTGILLLLKRKGGGHHFDVGASKLIIDGKIKIKNDSQLACFTKTGLRFHNKTELHADIVVFATGVGDMNNCIRSICGDQVADKCASLRGLTAEGELRGWWRNLGFPGLWYMMGTLQLGRFHSKHVALQIKAIEEEVYGPQYSLKEE